MTDKYGIDDHKLMYHPKRVIDWLDGKNIFPIYAEISPSGACNHRCTFCALDFMKYQHKFLDTTILKKRISELSTLGLKSIMFAGEGEPLLHKDLSEIINHTKSVGIDAALTTNGVLLNKNIVDTTLKSCTWIKVSIDAGTPETYSKIHGTKESDFNIVMKNLTIACNIKKENNYKCTLGTQLILLPENYEESLLLAKKLKGIGIDYLVIKPYSQHPLSKTVKYKNIQYDYEYLSKKLSKLNSDDFNIIFRVNTIKKWNEQKKPYDQCNALPFWIYMTSIGDVYGCSVYLDDNTFKYGNIYDSTFREIWESQKRYNFLNDIVKNFDVSKCRINCRMDEINRYLYNLKHPSPHINFI